MKKENGVKSFFAMSGVLTVLSLLFLGIILVFSVRGLPGNPTAEDIMASEAWRAKGPLELSPERGRFALLYSVVEDETVFFSTAVARIATPDLGINSDGKFVSLFAPFLSFLLIPGYLLGKMLGASVFGATLTIALFAIGNVFLIAAISRRLGASRAAAWLGSLAFLFGTPAFSYATTMYQHHVSVFLLLLSIFILLRSNGFAAISTAAFCFGFSIALDNPNAVLLFPVVVFALVRSISVRKEGERLNLSLSPVVFLGSMFFVVPMAVFMWYNLEVNGSAWRLSGTLPAVPALSSDGHALYRDPSQQTSDAAEAVQKTAVGFFQTRRLLNGFFIHLLSPDRGVVRFAPVILLGIFGWIALFRAKKTAIANVLVGVSLVALLFYSLWGDPWGGWAFGSRYLIPAYAMLGIGIGVAIEKWRGSIWFPGLFAILFAFSVGVNALGAITSSSNPPQVQVLGLEALSGREEKYTVARNWQYLQEHGSKSFLYRAWAGDLVDAETYYWMLVSFIIVGSSVPLAVLVRRKSRPLS